MGSAMRSLLVGALALLSSLPPSTALLVAPNSNCGVQCGNVLSSLSGTDLVCNDADYKNSVSGQVFESCIACELNSTYVDPDTKQSDLQWLLYNLRYTVSFCLFGYPNNTNVADTPCLTSLACADFQNGTELYLDTGNDTTYGYCDVWKTSHLDKCQACLGQLGTMSFISNYITALSAGCEYQTNASTPLPIQGSLFSSNTINITNPNIPTTIPVFHPDTSRFNLGFRIGVTIGGIAFLLLLAGCFIVARGKRRRRAYLARHAKAHGQSMLLDTNVPRFHDVAGSGSQAGSSNSPQNESAKGLMSHNRPWGGSTTSATSAFGDSPVAGRGGGRADQSYFSPYSSHYGSPVSPEDHISGIGGRLSNWPVLGGGLGGAGGGVAAAGGKEKEKETETEGGFEMARLGKEESERVEEERWKGHHERGGSRGGSGGGAAGGAGGGKSSSPPPSAQSLGDDGTGVAF